MKIIVCIKQVPGTTQVDIDEETGVLKRDGVESKINPYDLYALETALRLKASCPEAQVVAITMGPPQAEQSLREALMMGVDDVVLVSDRRFAGADVLATALTLSQAILAYGWDTGLILCGQQTTDGDTAQVGPEIAEFLGIPHASNVTAIQEFSAAGLTAKVDLPATEETIRIPLPCLVSVNKGIHTPRLPSYTLKKASRDRKVRTITLAELPDSDPAHYGLNGSPTQVIRIFPPEHNVAHERWEGASETLAARLYENLREEKFLV
ncbi:MAG: electron transfer flavoprotein subunit beta/FixA family protein [Kiritimatiellae bacterium]|nr:electron transfer flavoprotein subunit beta/FixA family protein [Kiritimatiellia bacterium]